MAAIKNKQGIVMRARAFLVALIAMFCILGPQSAYALEENSIKVGVTASLTGRFAEPGGKQLEGLQMWAYDINARGALLGRRVELVHYDDKSDPDTSARLYERLIRDDKVDLLIGPYSSTITLAASRVAEQYDVPMVTAGASSGKIWSRGYKNVFGIDAPAKDYMNLLIESAKERAGLTRIALVYGADEFTREVAQGVREQAAKRGMEIVFDAEYQSETADFAGLVRRMKASNPELVIGGTYLNSSIALVREAKRQQLSPQAIAFTVGPALPEFGDALGADAEGILGIVSWMRSGNIPMAYDFSYRYKAKYGRNAAAHAAYGYAAGQVLEAAVRLAGSLSKDDVRQQLQDMRFHSLLGLYDADETGKQLGKSIYVMQWQDGRRLLVLPRKLRDSPVQYPFKPWSER
jgi:branched-chain amino acid transport system substrate-binding protein